jgi:hypothetical protein
MTQLPRYAIPAAICVGLLMLVVQKFVEPAKTIVVCLFFVAFAIILCIPAIRERQRSGKE